MDTGNLFMVGSNLANPGKIVVHGIRVHHVNCAGTGMSAHGPLILSREQAMNLAAYLAVITDPDGGEFIRLCGEIRTL